MSPLSPQTIHAGAVAPYRLIVTVLSEQGDDPAEPYWPLDSGVTNAIFEVDRDTGESATWPASLSGAGPVEGGSEITLTHVYMPGDVTEPGVRYIRARLTHEIHGELFTEQLKLMVFSK